MIKITSKVIIILTLLMTAILDIAFAIAASIIFTQYATGHILMYDWFWKIAVGVLISNAILLGFTLCCYIYSRMNLTVHNVDEEQRIEQASKTTTSAEFSKQVAKKHRK